MLVSPQIQFPVYGLDPSWPGVRWLELFGDEIGDPLRWVSLGHRSRDGDALVMVKTYVRLATGRQYARWPAVRWSVDGRAVTAHRWQFAGGWAAFTGAVPGVYLYATGLGTDPDDLSLAVLADGGAYHFDLDQPLWPETLLAARAAAGAGDWPELRSDTWHPDHLRLMPGS